jgi:hypothetical protein
MEEEEMKVMKEKRKGETNKNKNEGIIQDP